MQCATFTGIRPVFAKNLIILEWYGMWYVKVVCPIILVTEPLAALHKGAAVLSCAAQRVRGPETPAAPPREPFFMAFGTSWELCKTHWVLWGPRTLSGAKSGSGEIGSL